MKGKSKVTEMRQRKKSNKHNDNSKNPNEKNQPKTIDNESSLKELKKIKEVLVNGSSSNKTEKNEGQVKDEAKNEHKNMNGILHPSIDVFHRLSSMFKELRIDWLRQIFKERDTNCEKKKDVSRLEYFNKEFIACFILVFLLAIVTRTYKIEEPPHVW